MFWLKGNYVISMLDEVDLLRVLFLKISIMSFTTLLQKSNAISNSRKGFSSEDYWRSNSSKDAECNVNLQTVKNL